MFAPVESNLKTIKNASCTAPHSKIQLNLRGFGRQFKVRRVSTGSHCLGKERLSCGSFVQLERSQSNIFSDQR